MLALLVTEALIVTQLCALSVKQRNTLYNSCAIYKSASEVIFFYKNNFTFYWHDFYGQGINADHDPSGSRPFIWSPVWKLNVSLRCKLIKRRTLQEHFLGSRLFVGHLQVKLFTPTIPAQNSRQSSLDIIVWNIFIMPWPCTLQYSWRILPRPSFITLL